MGYRSVWLMLAALLLVSPVAVAEWQASLFLGGNLNGNSDVRLAQPDEPVLDFFEQ